MLPLIYHNKRWDENLCFLVYSLYKIHPKGEYMITFVTALYHEALPIIQHFCLKKDTSFTQFEVFRSTDKTEEDNITLIISKHSGLSSAFALTLLSAKDKVSTSDILINIGVCGCNDKRKDKGTTFLINKIIDHTTNFSYYPDILYRHPFAEGTLVTYPSVQNNILPLDESNEFFLVDMEASYLYQAGLYFYQPNRMFFIKIVSDHMENEHLLPDDITKLIQVNMPTIAEWIKTLKLPSNDEISFTKEEEECIDKLTLQLQLTTTMKNELHQLLRYYKCKEGCFLSTIEEFLKECQVPVKLKSEGKKYFERLKKKLI